MTDKTTHPEMAGPPPMGGTVLAEEIGQQPDALSAFVRRQGAFIADLAAGLPAFNCVVTAARGSSDHAAEYARYVLPALWGHPVAPATPSLYTRYGAPPRLRGAFVLAISQSGQSPDIVQVVEAGRTEGCSTVAITNDAESPLAMAAEHVIDLGVGRELSIAATKTYTTQLAAVALLAIARLAPTQRARLQAAMDLAPAAMRATLRMAWPAATRLAARWAGRRRCLLLARGYNLATAHEIALKLRELARLQAQPFSVADFRHGSIALAEPGLPCLLVAPRDETHGDIVELVAELQQRGADVAVISPAPIGSAMHLPVAPGIVGPLSPLVAALPGQLLALELTRQTGIDADHPIGLTEKVVRTL